MATSHRVLHVNTGNIPHKKYGDTEDISCQIIGLSHIGSFKVPLKEDLEEHVQYLKEWEDKIGFPKTRHAIVYEAFSRNGATASLYLAPNLPSKSEKARAFGKYLTWAFLVDDLFDAVKLEQPLTTTYEALSKDIDVLTSILDGEINGRTNAPEPTSTLQHFKITCALMQDIHEGLTKAAPAFSKKENRKYFIKAVNDFLHGFLWNFDRPDSDHASEFAYLMFRGYYVGSYSFFEIVALLNDIDWEESQIDRESLEFRCWRSSFGAAFGICNDVMSLRKELEEGERENLIIHRHLNSGLPINAAVKQVIQVLNSELHDVQVYAERLLAHSRESSGMKVIVEMSYWLLDGHLWWYDYNKRHGRIDITEHELTAGERHKIIHGHKKKHNHMEGSG